ncbi:thioredoxin [Candidatus Sumerlaeota bacterium]|nr:thioredoxin [Candidatus Sumerlaeota bacterium]
MSFNQIAVTKDNFSQVVAQGVVLVDFWAPWCAPCRAMTPVIDQVAQEMSGRATVVKCDVDNARNLAEEMGIHSIPTLCVFRDGEEVDRIVGLAPKDRIVDRIERQVVRAA